MEVVKINVLEKSFGQVKALDALDLNVDEGKIFGLIGPDGAGKTTLIRILCSLLYPDSGQTEVLGLDPIRDYKKLRHRVGYMPGRFSLYHDLTVEENLSLFANIFGTTIKENYHLIRDIYVQIEPFKNRKAGALSGGMKQKLALCCAMIHKPDILFLDEPTTGVDPVSRKEFWDMLNKLNKEGLPILVSTPYMDEAVRCDEVALMQNGKILAIDSPEKINDNFGLNLFAIKSREKYSVLKFLRSLEDTHSVYSFGDELHFAPAKKNQDGLLIQKTLEEAGFGDCTIQKIEPGIEDTFMELMAK